MKLEQSFEVDAPLERVWEALVDVERVAPCLPGAAVTGRNDDGSYSGTFTIKIGPTTASYAGKLEMQDIDPTTHSATMHAQGSDKRGQGGATATISSRLTASNGATRVEVVTDYHITGRLARFGRGGMIEDISERLLREFAGRLQSSLSGGAGPEEPTAVHETVSADAEVPPPPTEAAAPEAAAPGAPPVAAADLPRTEPMAVSELPDAPGAEAEPASQAAAAPPPPPPAPPPPPPPPPPRPVIEPAEPVHGLSLVGSVLIDRIKRNPKPVIALAGGLLALRMMRRRR